MLALWDSGAAEERRSWFVDEAAGLLVRTSSVPLAASDWLWGRCAGDEISGTLEDRVLLCADESMLARDSPGPRTSRLDDGRVERRW